MRALLTALLLVSTPAYAGPQEMCSADLEFLDGTLQTAILECDSPYDGKCLKQVELPDGNFDWQEVECGK